METSLRFGQLEIHRTARKVSVAGRYVALGDRALELLLALIDAGGAVVSKAELLERVWRDLDVEEANIAVQVSALRKALGGDLIGTVPGVGYRWTGSPSPAPQDAPDARHPGGDGAPHGVLVGREADLAQVLECLQEHRLVTLTGAGGVGKTRLAHAVLARAGTRRSTWVDLSTVACHDEVAHATVRAVAGGTSTATTIGQLTALLGEHPSMLLVLDNCEHVADGVAALVDALLGGCEGLRILCTSQEPLHLGDEQVHQVAALAVPPRGTPAEVARCSAAVRLLAMRIRAVDRRWSFEDRHVPAAAELCRQLDGNPLAIEMAAARVPLLGIDGVLQRLEDRLRLLSHRRRGIPRRQASLLATLAWSVGLLPPQAALVLRRLSVFAGTFGMELALDVVAGDDLSRSDALDAMGVLAERSLIQVLEGRPTTYRLLESVRTHAREGLDASGEALLIHRRHREATQRHARAAYVTTWSRYLASLSDAPERLARGR